VTGWIEALAELSAAGRPAVLVTVLSAEGSTPREAGAKMVVFAGGFEGTVGGGHLEHKALSEARDLLAAAERGEALGPVVREFALGPSLGQCCGGRATVLFETVGAARWNVALFGAGHVGKAVVKLLADLPCAVTWIDARESEFPEPLPPNVRRVVTDAPEEEVRALPPGADVLVMTHSHQLDLEIVEAVMKRGEYRYLGLIGSRTKRARFEQRLLAQGRSAAELARLTCPIGLPGVGGKEPAEIAIAVAAQLLQQRSARAGPAREGVTAPSLGRAAPCAEAKPEPSHAKPESSDAEPG
jgi:xanthine dehydrogenase accessory factor